MSEPLEFKEGMARELIEKLESALYIIQDAGEELVPRDHSGRVYVAASPDTDSLYVGCFMGGVEVPFDRVVDCSVGQRDTPGILAEAEWFRKLADAIEAQAYKPDED